MTKKQAQKFVWNDKDIKILSTGEVKALPKKPARVKLILKPEGK